MRRSVAIAVALTALVSAVVPVPTASSAPANSLTIVTIDRHGHDVRSDASITNVQSGTARYVRSGRTLTVRAGTFLVLVDIVDGTDFTETIGAKRVQVSGATELTFRARFGRPVHASLDPRPPDHYTRTFQFSVCTALGIASLSHYVLGPQLYVLPTRLRRVGFAFSVLWGPADSEDPGPRWLGAAGYRNGIPAGAVRHFRAGALVPMHVSARRGPQAGRALFQFNGGGSADGCLSDVLSVITYQNLPSSFTDYVPPGRWGITEDAQDFMVGRVRNLRLGHAYSMRVNRAVWGPTRELPYTYAGLRLRLSTPEMWFVDPTLSRYGADANVNYRLEHRGQTLLQTRVPGNVFRIPTKLLPDQGWYTLTESAVRPPDRLFPGALSRRAELRFHFHGLGPNTQLPGYIAQFLPAHLTMRDSAAPGSRTTVSLRIRRDALPGDVVAYPADSVSAISVWWSGNRGQTWHRLPVTHRQGHWAMIVPNPVSGAVSLRATVIDVYGNSTRTTVIDGYGID